jgi:hypothetical protein
MVAQSQSASLVQKKTVHATVASVAAIVAETPAATPFVSAAGNCVLQSKKHPDYPGCFLIYGQSSG